MKQLLLATLLGISLNAAGQNIDLATIQNIDFDLLNAQINEKSSIKLRYAIRDLEQVWLKENVERNYFKDSSSRRLQKELTLALEGNKTFADIVKKDDRILINEKRVELLKTELKNLETTRAHLKVWDQKIAPLKMAQAIYQVAIKLNGEILLKPDPNSGVRERRPLTIKTTMYIPELVDGPRKPMVDALANHSFDFRSPIANVPEIRRAVFVLPQGEAAFHQFSADMEKVTNTRSHTEMLKRMLLPIKSPDFSFLSYAELEQRFQFSGTITFSTPLYQTMAMSSMDRSLWNSAVAKDLLLQKQGLESLWVNADYGYNLVLDRGPGLEYETYLNEYLAFLIKVKTSGMIDDSQYQSLIFGYDKSELGKQAKDFNSVLQNIRTAANGDSNTINALSSALKTTRPVPNQSSIDLANKFLQIINGQNPIHIRTFMATTSPTTLNEGLAHIFTSGREREVQVAFESLSSTMRTAQAGHFQRLNDSGDTLAKLVGISSLKSVPYNKAANPVDKARGEVLAAASQKISKLRSLIATNAIDKQAKINTLMNDILTPLKGALDISKKQIWLINDLRNFRIILSELDTLLINLDELAIIDTTNPLFLSEVDRSVLQLGIENLKYFVIDSLLTSYLTPLSVNMQSLSRSVAEVYLEQNGFLTKSMAEALKKQIQNYNSSYKTLEEIRVAFDIIQWRPDQREAAVWFNFGSYMARAKEWLPGGYKGKTALEIETEIAKASN